MALLIRGASLVALLGLSAGQEPPCVPTQSHPGYSISVCGDLDGYVYWSDDSCGGWIWEHLSVADMSVSQWFASPFYTSTIYWTWYGCLDSRYKFRVGCPWFNQEYGTVHSMLLKPAEHAALFAPWVGTAMHAQVVSQAETGQMLSSEAMFWLVR